MSKVDLSKPHTITGERPEPSKKEISNEYVGYLTGQLREILEASFVNEDQLRALKNIVADRVYQWWGDADNYLPGNAYDTSVKKPISGGDISIN